MDLSSRIGAVLRSDGLRKWAIRIGATLLVFEVFYVVGANFFLRTDLLTNLINKKPEKTNISWDSAVTYLPGFATVKGFTLRSQTPRDQVYVHVAEADARISLIKLAFKTIHIRDVDAKGVDFRYRERLDSPRRNEAQEGPLEPPGNIEFYPEIPGLSNPPDPKPEDLYPRKKKKRPWTIKITGADVEGPVKVALNEFRLEGDGSVGGGVTVKPRKTITIHRGRLGLDDIVDEGLSERKQEKLEDWFCDVELEQGTVTFGKPMEAEGKVRLKMFDTRPVVAMLKELGTAPKGLSMMPNIKDVGGTMDVGVGKGRTALDDVVLAGEKFEVLGWLHILDKKATGRLFINYGILAAGIALDQGKGKVHFSKPRKWFEEQQGPPPENADPVAVANQ